MTEATAAPMGHNGGPAFVEMRYQDSIKYRWAMALFADPKTPSFVIAMSWAIHWYSKPEGWGAALSNEQFVAMCGLSESSVTRGKKWLLDNRYVSIRVGKKGLKTQFQLVIPEKTNPELVVTQTTNPDEIGRHTEGSQREGSHTDDHRSSQGRPNGQIGSQGDALREKEIYIREKEGGADAPAHVEDETIEPVVYQKTKRQPQGGRAFWQQQLAPVQHSAVEMVNGLVKLVNGTRQEWVKMFQGDEENLDLALIEISGKIQSNSNRTLEQQVMSQLAAMVRDRKDRDARYQKGVERNAKGKATGKAEDMAARRERIRQHAIEAAEAMERNRGRS